MKLRILTVAAAGVMALGLTACQQKTEEAPAAPADVTVTTPADTGAMATTPPPADASATVTTTTPPADTATTTESTTTTTTTGETAPPK